MLKSEKKVLIETIYGDLPVSSGYSPNLLEHKLWPQTGPFFDIFVNHQKFYFSQKLLCQIGGKGFN